MPMNGANDFSVALGQLDGSDFCDTFEAGMADELHAPILTYREG